MKKCQQCGAELEDDASFCLACGAQQEGAPDDTVTEAAQPEQPEQTDVQTAEQATEQKSGGGFKNKVNDVVTKAKNFDSKHHIILNAIVMACAIVVLFVALFAPIKVKIYANPISEKDGSDVEITYTEVNQSIFQVIGSVFYIKASDKQKAEVNKDYAKAYENYQKEMAEWILDHPTATEEEAREASIDIQMDCLSDVNYLAYILANTNIKDAINGTFIETAMTAALGTIIAVLAIVMAIISLIYIVKAIINIVKKQPQTGLFKYMTTMLSLAVSGLTIMFCTPMLVAGGNMFAVALFVAITMLITASCGALIVGKEHKLVVLKRSIIALVAMIAFFILCGNILSVVDKTSASATVTTIAPTGFGLHSVLSVLQFGDNAPDITTMIAKPIMGLIMYIFVAGAFASYVGTVMKRAFRRLAAGDDGKKVSIMRPAIAAIVTGLLAIILGFMSGTITNAFFSMVKLPKADIKVQWLARAQIWVSLIFVIGIIVFSKVFLPNDTVKASAQETQNAEQPEEKKEQPAEQPAEQPEQPETI
ncbi:MAG: zinc ribbon domain-containing protein [Clostridiales bacterium]|nr:zinc ribbon domain-containing protein [Clostridiales bacterium]